MSKFNNKYIYPSFFKHTSTIFETTFNYNRNETFELQIFYKNSPKAEAIQWMEAEQTMSKTHPYMYSQCQVTFSFLPFLLV